MPTEPKHTKGEIKILELETEIRLAKLEGRTLEDHQKVFRNDNGDFWIGLGLGNMVATVRCQNELPRKKAALSPDPEGMANAARLVAGWNLLNRLDEMGVDAEQVPEIVEALQKTVANEGLTIPQMLARMKSARQALTKKG